MRNIKYFFLFLFIAVSANMVFAQGTFPVGEIVILRSFNYQDRFIRHQNFHADITAVTSDLDRRDASFKVVAALNGKLGYISFESVNYPGYFLRHQGFRIKLHKRETAQLYKDDTSFKPVSGLADASGSSFESSNYPGYFLRHSNFNMYIGKHDGSALFRKDATFMILK